MVKSPMDPSPGQTFVNWIYFERARKGKLGMSEQAMRATSEQDAATLYTLTSSESIALPSIQGKKASNSSQPTNKRQINLFCRWVLTPLGFGITIYGLNIIAWGGMLFLLMCNAAPSMCHPNCNDLYSSRRIWIEIDSQILNALFCVTGFGLAPWRIRDFGLWCLWRLGSSDMTRKQAHQNLAKVHSRWYSPSAGQSLLSTGSDTITKPSCFSSCNNLQTSPWKMDVVVWGNIMNTVFQVCLATFMWAMNRFTRPSWTTGLFVCLACSCAASVGIVTWIEKRSQKRLGYGPGCL